MFYTNDIGLNKRFKSNLVNHALVVMIINIIDIRNAEMALGLMTTKTLHLGIIM